jgi:maltose/maltodextrin transport system substrate-binding protein/arabinogalactan oligomer/maltooligosaccharide transport system substrate-binding protein
MNRLLNLLLVFAFAFAGVGAAFAQEDEGLLIWADATRAAVIQELAKDFTEEFGIPVEVQEIGLGDSRDQLLVAGPVGEGPDILIQPHDTLGQLVANGALAPIDLAGLEDEFLPSALDAVTLGGETYCLPYGTENVAFIRNPDMISENPATWQEVAELAAQFAEEGKYAFLVQTGNTYHTFPITTAFGGYIFGIDEEGNYDVSDIGLDSEGGIASAEWLQMMAEEGYMVPDVNDDVVFELYAAGDLAMFITGPWWLQRIRDTGQPYTINAFPGVDGVSEQGQPFSGVQCFAMSAFSENQLLAETFLLDYVATDEFMQALFDVNPLPSAWLSVRESIDDADVAGLAAAGANAVPMPNIPEMSAVWAASDAALNLIINQQTDGATAYTDAAAQILATIEKSHKLAEMGGVVVNVPGSWQAAAGCEADWSPDCDATLLALNEDTGMYEGTFEIAAGEYEYKVALNFTWDENYGVDGVADGDNYALTLEADSTVTFSYDPETHLLTTTVGE